MNAMRPTQRPSGTYILVSGDEMLHIGRRVLVQLFVVPEDKNGDIDGAQDRKLVCLFKQASLSLEKGPR